MLSFRKNAMLAILFLNVSLLISCSPSPESIYNKGLDYFNGNGVPVDQEKAVYLYRKAALKGHAKAQYDLGYCYYKGIYFLEDKAEAVKWYSMAADNDLVEAQLALAQCYFKGDGVPENKTEAVNWYRKAAEQGDAKAQYSLALCYEKGEGVAVDKAEAIKWYSMAADNNLIEAQFVMAQNNYNGDGVAADKTKAIPLYRKAAEQGDAKAQYSLGLCYEKGEGVTIDKAEAIKWYSKAAENNLAEAQFVMAQYYYNGDGVPEDKTKAIPLYRKAAEQGIVKAQYCLGLCYEKGEGVAIDKAEAIKWYSKATENNLAEAQFIMAQYYYNGDGVAEDKAKAISLYHKAAEQGIINAQLKLASCYYKGDGVSKDLAETVKWFRMAAEQGDAKAQYNLGLCYEKGEGVSVDKTEAIKWYRMAAEQGNVKSQYNLALCYEKGKGVAVDKAEAIKWYSKAAEQGHFQAKKNLVFCNNDIDVDSFFSTQDSSDHVDKDDPLYKAFYSISRYKRIDNINEIIQSLVLEINKKPSILSGYSHSQAALILTTTADIGYNIVIYNVNRTQDNALKNFNSLIDGDISEGNSNLKKLVELKTNKEIATLEEAAMFYEYLYQTVKSSKYGNNEDNRIATIKYIYKFLDTVDRMDRIEGCKKYKPKSFSNLISLKADFEKMANEIVSDRRTKYIISLIINDITEIENNVPEDVQDMDIYSIIEDAQNVQRNNLVNKIRDMGIFEGDTALQKDFSEALLLRDILNSFNSVPNYDLLVQDAQDNEGNIITITDSNGKFHHIKNWEFVVEKESYKIEFKKTIQNYCSGYHKIYLRGVEIIKDFEFKNTIQLLENYKKADTKTKKILLENKEYQTLLSYFSVEMVSLQILDDMDKFLMAVHSFDKALVSGGTPIEDKKQLMLFIHKVTYGAMFTMSTDSFANSLQEISIAMIRVGASGDDVLKMADMTAQSARRSGSNVPTAVINGIKFGLQAMSISRGSR